MFLVAFLIFRKMIWKCHVEHKSTWESYVVLYWFSSIVEWQGCNIFLPSFADTWNCNICDKMEIFKNLRMSLILALVLICYSVNWWNNISRRCYSRENNNTTWKWLETVSSTYLDGSIMPPFFSCRCSNDIKKTAQSSANKSWPFSWRHKLP